MKCRIVHSTLIFLLAFVANGQEFNKKGTSGFTFLNIPATARTAALGETSISLLESGAGGAFLNPATLGFARAEHHATFSYAPWFVEMKHYAASYAVQTEAGVFALSAVAMDYGSFVRTEKIPGQREFVSKGTFSAKASALGVTYANRLTDRFAFGLTLKYVSERIDVFEVSNVVLDGGVLYDTGFESLRIAASLQNFGTNAQYRNDPFKMPSSVRLGASMELLGNRNSDLMITGLVEALHPNDGEEHLNTGVEVWFLQQFALRGGYKFFYDEDSFSAGLGIHPSIGMPLGFDIAVTDHGRLGTVVRFTLEIGM